MTALTTGASTTLLEGAPRGLVIDVYWDSGFVPCEAVMFVCGATGRVLSDDYFVFYNQERSPRGEVLHRRYPSVLPQRAQFQIHVAALPQAAEQLDVVLTAQEEDLEHVTDVRLVVWDPNTGGDLARYEAPAAGPVRSSLLGQLYRQQGRWKMRALGVHYDRDLALVAQEHGVNV